MNKEEAMEFYLTKLNRAKAASSEEAYTNILSALHKSETFGEAKGHIDAMSKTSPVATRRAIYRKALRELEV